MMLMFEVISVGFMVELKNLLFLQQVYASLDQATEEELDCKHTQILEWCLMITLDPKQIQNEKKQIAFSIKFSLSFFRY